jgi:PadR family transcriptional regulator PadR
MPTPRSVTTRLRSLLCALTAQSVRSVAHFKDQIQWYEQQCAHPDYLAPQGTMSHMDPPDGLSTALRRGTLEFCVLALLRHGELYSVELARRLGSEQALTTSEGTLYPLLARLRRAGWVTTTWQDAPAGPPRRYYALTPGGHAALDHFRAQWTAFRDTVDRIVGTEPK